MRYACIVADPPWKVKAGRSIGRYEVSEGKQLFGVTGNQSRKLEYPTLSIKEISELPISEYAAAHSHLYLWTINKYISESYDIAKAWGFKPSTMLVWAKSPMGGGLGGSYGLSTEYCLFCRRGTLASLSRQTGTWFNWKRPYNARGKPKHSAKPPEFFSMVESVSPGPRIELFARERRDNWDAWGNEVESTAGIDL